jgi:hypothetical protein
LLIRGSILVLMSLHHPKRGDVRRPANCHIMRTPASVVSTLPDQAHTDEILRDVSMARANARFRASKRANGISWLVNVTLVRAQADFGYTPNMRLPRKCPPRDR